MVEKEKELDFMSKIFVRNLTGTNIVENKPGLGYFAIPGGSRLEINDVYTEKEIDGQKFRVLVNTARQIAESLVRDRKAPGLKVEVEEDKPVFKKPEVKKPEEMIEKKKEEGKK
jgi:hypothetical protein